MIIYYIILLHHLDIVTGMSYVYPKYTSSLTSVASVASGSLSRQQKTTYPTATKTNQAAIRIHSCIIEVVRVSGMSSTK